MLGFELDVEGKILTATIEPEKIITVTVTKTVDGVFLHFGGTDFRSLESMTWLDTELRLEDRLSVEIKNVGRESNPIEIHGLSWQCPLSNEDALQDERDLNQFYEWQEILQQKGLL